MYKGNTNEPAIPSSPQRQTTNRIPMDRLVKSSQPVKRKKLSKLTKPTVLRIDTIVHNVQRNCRRPDRWSGTSRLSMSTRSRVPFPVRNVTKISCLGTNTSNTNRCTKKLSHATSVKRLFARDSCWSPITCSIWTRNHFYVKFARARLLEWPRCRSIGSHTSLRRHTCAKSAAKRFLQIFYWNNTYTNTIRTTLPSCVPPARRPFHRRPF